MSKLIDNFELIKTLLSFPDDDTFFFGQIIQRRKDLVSLGINPTGPDNIVIKDYFIKSIEHLDEKTPVIKALCNTLNARFYLNLNRRSKKRTAFELLKIVAENIGKDSFDCLSSSYATACGQATAESNKKWIVDLDADNLHLIGVVIEAINNFEPIGKDKIISTIPTLNGVHLITSPFRSDKFQELFHDENIDIQKNNPTVVYCNI